MTTPDGLIRKLPPRGGRGWGGGGGVRGHALQLNIAWGISPPPPPHPPFFCSTRLRPTAALNRFEAAVDGRGVIRGPRRAESGARKPTWLSGSCRIIRRPGRRRGRELSPRAICFVGDRHPAYAGGGGWGGRAPSRRSRRFDASSWTDAHRLMEWAGRPTGDEGPVRQRLRPRTAARPQGMGSTSSSPDVVFREGNTS